jgi:hypothetical protein
MKRKSLVSNSPSFSCDKNTLIQKKKSLIIYVLGVIDMFVSNAVPCDAHKHMLLVCNIFKYKENTF